MDAEDVFVLHGLRPKALGCSAHRHIVKTWLKPHNSGDVTLHVKTRCTFCSADAARLSSSFEADGM